MTEKITLTCLKCGTPLAGRQRKFCCWHHEKAFNQLRRYHAMPKTEEFKRKRREYFQSWVERNREHFNEMMRNNYHKRKAALQQQTQV